MNLQLKTIRAVAALILAFAGGMEFSNMHHDAAQTATAEAAESLRASLMDRNTNLINQNTAATAQIDSLNKLAAVWQTRADSCEAKFKITTMLLEPRPAPANPSLPLLGGTLSLSLNSVQPAPGLRAVWAIPAQIKPETTLAGAQYTWIENGTNRIIGTYFIVPTGPQNH